MAPRRPRSTGTRSGATESLGEHDVVVVGAGAGGLATAVTAAFFGARVLVLERDEVCGGATAWSGGWIWAPGNPLARPDGVLEDAEEVRRYLRAVLGDGYDPARIDAFLAAAPAMVAFFSEHTSLGFVAGSRICDIYGDLPGAGTGHRSVAPKPVNARRLDPRVRAILRRQKYETSFLGLGIMAGPDLAGFLAAARGNPRGLLHATRRVTAHLFDLLTHRRGMQLVNGTALVGRLLQSALDLGVDIRVSSPVTKLVRDADGRVRGVVADTPEGPLRVAARGVVLAAGGFPHDVERRRALFPRTPTGAEHWPLAPAGADGAGTSLGESAGGRLRTDLSSPAAWCPVSLVPYRDGRVGTVPHILDRAKPGCIAVLRNGRRFVNEADGYHDFVSALLASAPEGQPVVSWLIADARFVRRYPLGMAKPRPVPLFPYVRSGYLSRGRTLTELARSCGIDPEGLESTVAAFNEQARRGLDPDFGRGTTPFNRYGGDPAVGPNPSLAPLEKGPFYAVRVLPGSFGTFAGLATDEKARVLDGAGVPVPGLFAVGCDQVSVMGGHYPAGGINLGPAMAFGYLAGRELARVAADPGAG
jgi:succinate dehydrogenase/fumarate reductase flavoprotein subunit